jgi:hypothetical protein
VPYDIAEIDAPAFAALAHDDAPTADEALANPEAALAFLFLSPRPCAALDALLAA